MAASDYVPIFFKNKSRELIHSHECKHQVPFAHRR